VTTTDDQTIIKWIRKTEALAENLMVDPADVYTTLIERGYSRESKRTTLPTDRSVQGIASVFRPEEVLSIDAITKRFTENTEFDSYYTDNPNHYIRLMLSRHAGDHGLRRFKKVARGKYRLALGAQELRLAILDELKSQKTFVSARRLIELFDVPYTRIVDTLSSLVEKGELVTRVNATTDSKEWCLSGYTESIYR